MSFLIPVLIGVSAGISSGLFGIGGGIIIVPLVLYFFKVPQQSAIATSLISLLLPVGSLGLLQYYRSGFVNPENLKIGLTIAAGMLIGTFFGAKLATSLQAEILSKMFAVFLIIVAIRIWTTS